MAFPAARLTDMHVCPMLTVLVPHVGGPIVGPGAPTVMIGERAADLIATARRTAQSTQVGVAAGAVV